MPTRRLQLLIVLSALILITLPAASHAGDAPIFVIGDWGVGEIDGKYMLYTGRNSYVFTPIPTPPRGPLWNFAYTVFPFVVLGGVGYWLYRRRHNPALQRTGAAGRAFEVQKVSGSGSGH
ncbi:MAG TPA: hypothetical protein VF624_11495 [Tepidisphaeraceae bacterium]|jgi:hypothetical protein